MRRSAHSRLSSENSTRKYNDEERHAEVCPQETANRLKKLYPSVHERENDISLPRRWDVSQASSYLEISRNGLTVSFKKNVSLQDDKDPSGVVRGDAPIPSSVGLYYFEVKILHGHRGCMGVGLSKAGGELNRMPGWDPSCYGYHGDDGNFFYSCGNGTPYGPKFGTGDVIGCGIDTLLYQVFFTKNGKHLGVAFEGEEPFGELYPTVGLKTPGEQLHVNFGHKPFVFDFEGYRKVLNKNKMKLLEKTKMPEAVGEQMDRIVSSFLGNSGAFNTLQVFRKVTEQENNETEFLKQRKEIVDMIMCAAHGAAIQARIEAYFPGCLERDPRVQLILLCLRYIDLANTLHEPPPSFKKPVSESGQPVSPTELRPRPQKFGKNSSGSNQKRSRDNRQNVVMQSANKQSIKISEACLNNPKICERFTDEDTGEEMIKIDGLTITKNMFIDLQTNNQYEKLAYVMKMGREIEKLSRGLNLPHKERQILEISMTMVLTTRPIEKHPLSAAQRRYIANLVTLMINRNTPTGAGEQVFSELRGMFIGWKALHSDASSRDHPSAAISFMRNMVIEPVDFDEQNVIYSDEPMEDNDQIEDGILQGQ